ncbi:outer membrane protein assembly factor BamB [Flavobacterium sp. HSC-32F16]|uniref:hypothetical protein n=1 Tax=Flavobacterium sp. HSC-32F16 TaxID=2910964 RepID=UPI0020A612EA|nr:hypothetical protein [Flavobacterium sp. HSC-32F16]MCP2029481.1 outer membrane protein assembly factor BamB [Flavobacterium sp. HSC-32F16]
MKVDYKNFEVEVLDDPNYTLASTDNLRKYQKVFYDEKHSEDRFDFTIKHAIIIKENETEISSALICEFGGATGISDNSFFIEDYKIWILVCNKIYCLEIPSLNLIWQKELDSFTNFRMYKLENDFIIHGELEIFRITKEGDVIWSFGGRDIWINAQGKNEFVIENNTIRLFDFESNEYVLDFYGNVIEDNPRTVPTEIKKRWWQIFS